MWSNLMGRAIAVFILAACLVGCGQFGILVDGVKYAKAVEGDLEQITGVKPQVGFNWNNGRLRSVTVTFPRILNASPIIELADKVRAVVVNDFKQKPDTIVLGFALGSWAIFQRSASQRVIE
jgi:hypothetical protein